ncbi:hypothetical protein [Mycolicibacterium palauense]|uniref:hypothetical protein n=1 Tax=Mycolicibacterium palauense TaxID=2034511 RepID=UPI00159BEF22|nr:hypothetical protein [Mycolicibacterium palauense]
MFADTVDEVVRCVGGWVFDRSMAGWVVTVLLPMRPGDDLRPLRILGAGAVDRDSALGGPSRCPAAVSVAAQVYSVDRVRADIRRSVEAGAVEATLWGERSGPASPAPLPVVRHGLSLAARSFKAHALAAARRDPIAVGPVAVDPAAVDSVEVFSVLASHPTAGPIARPAGVTAGQPD